VRALWCLAVLVAVAWSPLVLAVPPLVIGDVPTADRGTLEVYAGAERVRSGAVEWAAPADELVLGISSRQELTLEVPYVVTPAGHGLGDLVLGTKLVLLPEGSHRPGLAGSIEWKLATGDVSTGTGSGSMELGFLLRAQKSARWLTLIVNGGYTLVGEPRTGGIRQPRRGTEFLGAGAKAALAAGISAVADVYWRSADTPGEPARLAGDAGLVVRLTEHLAAQGAVGTSLRPDGAGGPGLRLYLGLEADLGLF
jgi:hypothetical protein